MKKTMVAAAAAVGLAALAQPMPGAPGGRDAFLRQQAYEEVQRVAGQVDVSVVVRRNQLYLELHLKPDLKLRHFPLISWEPEFTPSH